MSASEGARVFKGSVQLPADSYAAYVSAFPTGYSTEEDGPGARVTRWLGADHLAEYKFTVLGSGQRLTTADVERLRQQASANAVVSLRGTSAERYQQAGFILITLLAASGTLDRTAVGRYDLKTNPSVVAEITGVRDDDRVEKRFRLEAATALRVYAIAEGSSGGMDDYGWIEDAKTGKTVWEMTYRSTAHAGGASKNRRFDGTITLPAGEYVVKFETDGSHSFADWNADPPEDPDAWGITLFRKGSVQR